MAVSTNPFFPTYRKIAGARFQLICLPYAGGTSLAYRTWEPKLGPTIEVSAAELPGRGRRFGEKPHQSLDTLIPSLVESISAILDGRPFAIFGHSMGALLAFELAHRLLRSGAKLPSVLFLSGRGTRDRDENIHLLPEKALIERLRSYSGTPAEILDNPDMMEIFLPTIRADFAIAGTPLGQTTQQPLPVPLEVLGGSDDPHVPLEDLSSWASRTTSQFNITVFPGGHFFQREHEDDILRLLTSRLATSRV